MTPWLSSVDNGWLAVGLRIVASRVPELRTRAQALFDSMDFGFYYRPERNQILFHYTPASGDAPCCYDTIVSESRIASYIGIEKGELPARHYYGAFRAFPDNCGIETKPVGFTRSYLGQPVFEGALPYAGMRVTPSWGGSMFEALMPSLFVPEERWGPGSWGANHPVTARAQIHHGLREARYGYWGFSPANIPEGGYGDLRRRRDRHGPERQRVQRAEDAHRPRLSGLPRPAGEARPAAVRVHQRRRHAARRVPGPPLRPARGARQPAPARARLPRHVREVGLPRHGQRPDPAASRTTTSHSTRAWSWPRSATRSAATSCAARS